MLRVVPCFVLPVANCSPQTFTNQTFSFPFPDSDNSKFRNVSNLRLVAYNFPVCNVKKIPKIHLQINACFHNVHSAVSL
jgi:hypothetical protein